MSLGLFPLKKRSGGSATPLQPEGAVQVGCVLPGELIVPILAAYNDLYQEDLSVKIIPALLTCKAFHHALIPLLYRKVTLHKGRQAETLANASVEGLSSIRELVILPCQAGDNHKKHCTDMSDYLTSSKAVQASQFGHAWQSAERRMKSKGKTIRLDVARCHKRFGPMQSLTLRHLPPARLVYSPQNLDCPEARPRDNFATGDSDFIEAAAYYPSKDWTMDISWLLDPRTKLEKFPHWTPEPQQYDHVVLQNARHQLFNMWNRTGISSWVTKSGLTKRIIITCERYPHVFRDPDQEYADAPKHVFQFQGGSNCYGPKQLLHVLFEQACYAIIPHLIERAGGEWTTPSSGKRRMNSALAEE